MSHAKSVLFFLCVQSLFGADLCVFRSIEIWCFFITAANTEQIIVLYDFLFDLGNFFFISF